MKQYQAFIFDLDGTIVDSGKTVLRIINDLRVKNSLQPLEYENLFPFLSIGGNELIRAAFGEGADQESLLRLFRQTYLLDPLADEVLYEGVIDFLNLLRSKGKKTAICSNKPNFLVKKVLERHNLTAIFDVIIAGGDLLSKKPSPEGLIKILSEFNVHPRLSILFGDSVIDQIAAQSAGVAFGFHANGYDDGVLVDNVYIRYESYKELFGEIL